MKAFYSILYCPIRPTVDERVSIALLLRGEGKVFFSYSHDKLAIIKDLLPKEAYSLLKANLKNIEGYIKEKYGDDLSADVKDTLLDESYVGYLSNYANNLLTFSKPKGIDIPVTAEYFNKLYSKYVFEKDAEKHKEESIIHRVKRIVNPKIKTHVNLDIELNSEQVPNLAIPTKVWFIGENERDVTGETFEFEGGLGHLKNLLHSYFYLLETLKEKNKPSGKYFVVGKEPSKNLEENHRIWDEIRQLGFVTYLPENEAEETIKGYMEEHHVKPYVKS